MSELNFKLMNLWHRSMEREEGQGLVEYALILVLVSVVAIGALTLVGTNINKVLNSIVNTLSNAVGA
jgi:pilus assembly protein Flp/PilA